MATILSQILALGVVQTVALATCLLVLVGLAVLYYSTIRYPANLPRLREHEGATRFSLKTRIAYYTECKNMYREAYDKVCRLFFHAERRG